ncbi:hypothetical protein B5M47_01285 [candidate division CPR3 bacterium 4484_211]|uniref:DUF4340 domain-containing protein n=1 Tax=candidate division CPR3 bacterium 4484_211 TaxID=1968527 RepID=A0A1W9NYV1_UNCC3|nr:MAG: hypothetical protein B5M47_01285 [candidate division CPR3 bacterium 4484_211]
MVLILRFASPIVLKNKNILLLFILVFLIGIGYLLTRGLPWGRGETKLFPHFNKEEVNRIEVKKGDDEIKLIKENSRWVVETKEKALADEQKVANLLETTGGLSRSELISTNPEKQKDMQVDESGIRIRLFRDDSLTADYYLGKSGPGYGTTYIRKEGEDRVYLVSEWLSGFSPTAEWRNLVVLKFVADDVSSVAVWHQGNSFTLEKKDGEWKLTGEEKSQALENSLEPGSKESPAKGSLDSKKIQTFITTLSSLRANDLQMKGNLELAGLNNPQWKYVINLKDGSLYELAIGNQDENEDYFVKTNQSEIIYILPSYTVEDFPQKIEDLVSSD